MIITKKLTFNGDVKCLASGRWNSIVGMALEYIVRVACYVAEYQLMTNTDHSTLIVVVYDHSVIIIIITTSSSDSDRKSRLSSRMRICY